MERGLVDWGLDLLEFHAAARCCRSVQGEVAATSRASTIRVFQMKERRKAKRVSVGLRVLWEGEMEKSEGRLVDLSVSGCFIQTPARVSEQEQVVLEIYPPREGYIFLCAKVVHRQADGFAVHFTQSDARDRQTLEWLLKAELYRTEKTPHPSLHTSDTAPVEASAYAAPQPLRPAGRIPPPNYAPEECAWCQGTGKEAPKVRCGVCGGKGGLLVAQPALHCPACDGAGHLPLGLSRDPCPGCDGGGWQHIWHP